MILHQAALKKSRFLGGGGCAAHISLGDTKANTLDATIGNQTNLEFNREYSLTWLISLGHQHGLCFIVLGHQYGHRDVM